jgi:hypothetical protein
MFSRLIKILFSQLICLIKGHRWVVVERHKTVKYDDMGYPLRLCNIACNRCGKRDQIWIDTDFNNDDEIVDH